VVEGQELAVIASVCFTSVALQVGKGFAMPKRLPVQLQCALQQSQYRVAKAASTLQELQHMASTKIMPTGWNIDVDLSRFAPYAIRLKAEA
jgi:hypothetical protein